ncbi:MAG TPA: aminotransferase class I/II-fold pyridoxal phosphate-dependent enzyme [Acidimicrobiales bacterium]|nr:aminotransferase class I/II-fold pyridoxal phosphate-dependent enzyme [Acidimicrobiales bacterium]
MTGVAEGVTAEGFRPPPYPYDRLDVVARLGERHDGGLVDLSVGTPCDPPPPSVVEALATSGAERGYPASIGSGALRQAATAWIERCFGVSLEPVQVAACVGTKEMVATLPQWLRLRTPGRDTVLYPAVSYPTYEMGATLARCRAVAVPVDDRFRLDLGAVSDEDAERALVLWVNSPGNPAGQLEDLGAAAEWGRARGVPVFSDECYVEFTWDGPGSTILSTGCDGVVAVHSLSKRSNLAGLRAGFYAGDGELVTYLSEVRKHAGFMVPGPVQAAAAAALGDQAHVDDQRRRYAGRLARFAEVLRHLGVDVELPGGGFYLWARAPEGGGDRSGADDDGQGPAWRFTRRLVEEGGALVSPGEFYGCPTHVRAAMVAPDDRIELVARRLGLA